MPSPGGFGDAYGLMVIIMPSLRDYGVGGECEGYNNIIPPGFGDAYGLVVIIMPSPGGFGGWWWVRGL